ncbi:FecR family protein [Luteimonas huabeiensis]|uniref:FecR family protein n=1 Tax=Luteimonas huabeiensis TaxID=1244513 RepID=UPI0009DE09B3|nr:FecR domain-containing protein [Luteimonas huabeiensis]
MTGAMDRGGRADALDQAADWLLRLREPALDERELEAWTAWMADPEHARAFDDISLLWDAAGELPPEAVASAPAASAAAPRPAARRPRRRRWLAAAAAACAALAVGALWWRAAEHSGDERPLQIATGVGEHREVSLADGSVVELGAASRVRVRYSDARREVELLEGVGRFSVAHAPERPFEVRAAGTLVQAIGTRFSVGLRPRGAVAVAVDQGVVQFNDLGTGRGSASGRPLRLTAGERGLWLAGEGLSGPLPSAPRPAGDGLERSIAYLGEPLSDVIGDLNRYSPVPIELDRRVEASVPVTGRWHTGDLDAWLDGLASAASLSVVRTDGRILLVPAAASEVPAPRRRPSGSG